MSAHKFTVHPRIDDISAPVVLDGFKSKVRAEQFQEVLTQRLTEAVENGELTGFEMTLPEQTDSRTDVNEPLLKDIDMYVESIVQVLNRI